MVLRKICVAASSGILPEEAVNLELLFLAGWYAVLRSSANVYGGHCG